MKTMILTAAVAAASLVSSAEHVEIPCLQATGQQWVNTLYTPSSTDRVAMKVRVGSLAAKQALYCSRGTAANQATFSSFVYTTGKIGFDFGGNAYSGGYSSAFGVGGLAILSAKNKEFKVNGSTTQTASGSFSGQSPFALFASHLAGSSLSSETTMSEYATCAFYYFRVYDKDDNLVCDCVPVHDTSAEVGSFDEYGVYDRVAKRFLPNNGTAAFSVTDVTVSTAADLVTAVASAKAGDTVYVADGTYQLESTVTIPYGVTVKAKNGRNKVFFEPAETVIQQFVVNGGTLQDVTIQNFTASPALVRVLLGGYIIGCTIYNNAYGSTQVSGRGIVNCENGTVSRCTFKNNVAGATTCSALSSEGSCICENTFFYGNKGYYGGAINMHSGSWTVKNCTFIAHSGNGSSWAHYYNANRSPSFYNCLFLDSAVPHGYRTQLDPGPYGATKESTGKPNYYNCLVVGSGDPTYWKYKTMSNCIDIPYPGFVSTAADDFHLASGSPMIGAGRAVTYSDEENCDLDGTPHPATPSIGCYEYNSAYVPTHRTIYVSKDGDNSDGSSWAKAFTSPQSALEIAPNGADVLVAAGDYEVTGHQLNVTNAVRFIGIAGRDQTTLRAKAKGYRVVRIANKKALVKGFTITGGDVTDVGASFSSEIFYSAAGGAGVCIAYVGGELKDCRITGCTDNGGAFGHYSSAIFADGGRISGCIVDNNTSKVYAVLLMGTQTEWGYAQMDSCLICNNTVGGPAVSVCTETAWSSYTLTTHEVALRNCTLLGNKTAKGAAVASVSRQLDGGRVYNCLMLDGSDTVRAWSDSSASHATNATDTAWRNNAAAVTVGTNCLVGTAETLKVRGSGRPLYSSACRDAGFGHLFATEPYATDVTGAARISAAKGKTAEVDIGAYELQGDAPGMTLLVK